MLGNEYGIDVGCTDGVTDGTLVGLVLRPFEGYKDGSIVGCKDIDGFDDGSKDGFLVGILLILGFSDSIADGNASGHWPQYKGQLAFVPLKFDPHR